MEEEISCSDKIIVTKGDGKRREETINLEVERGGFFGYTVHITDCSFMGSVRIPIKDWAKVKDIVDKLIVRLENLKQAQGINTDS